MSVRVRRFLLVLAGFQQLLERQLPHLFVSGHVEQQRWVDPPGRGAHDLGMGVVLAHPLGHAPQRRLRVGDLVELVDHHQSGCAVPRWRGGVPIDGVEVRHRIQHVDHAARPDSVDTAESDDAGDRHRLGQAAGLHDDRVQPQTGISQPGQRHVETALVGQAADASAGDRRGLVDLAGDQSCVDIELTEVVDHHADSCVRGTQHMVEQRRLPGAEITGQGDDGYRLHSWAGYLCAQKMTVHRFRR